MNLNLTLCVQACNFFIAYLIVRFLLLKPIVRVIQQELEREESFARAIEQGKKEVTHKEHKRAELWAACRAYFVRQSPVLAQADEIVLRDITPDMTIESVSEQELQHQADVIAHHLLARMEDQHD